MPFNGSGVFTSVYSWSQDAANGIDISSSRMDAQEADYTGNGFGNCLTRDGQGYATANLPMNTYRHTGVGNAVAVTDYAAAGQIQSNAILFAVGGGSGDAITATLAPVVASLVDGMQFCIRAPGANTLTNPTFAPNGLTAHTITKGGGSALAANDILSGQEIILRYVSASTRWELINPNVQVSSVSLSANNTWTGVQTFGQAGAIDKLVIAGNTSGGTTLVGD